MQVARKLWRTALPAAMLVLGGCMDMDPFGLAHRRIAGPYGLEQWEDFRTYYLIRGAGFGAGADVLEGAVERIGWNDRYIVVSRVEFSTDRHGWMIVDSRRREILGPFTGAELARRPEARGIRPMAAGEAWHSLPVRPNPFGYLVLAALAAWITKVVRARRPLREARGEGA
ncbi:MAG TPA: hypothetical protein VFR81_03865 [Longimicrobium sp.]|nr:hypothetical protein [Longimicrobium sp.]